MRHFRGLVCILVLVCGCPADSPAPEAPFPHALVLEVLDREPDDATGQIIAQYPGSVMVDGSFRRYEISGSQLLSEIILFRSVRTGRVDSVILKYRPDLTRADREKIFSEVGHPELFGSDVVSTVPWRRGMKLRVTPADRFGRLTLTVEP